MVLRPCLYTTHNARCSEWMSQTLDFAFFLPLIGSIVYTSVYLHGDRAAPNTPVSSPMKVVACLMEVEAAVVAIKTSASSKEYDGYGVYPEVRL